MPSDLLVLFDIDGTLLRRAGPHHRDALAAAVRTVTGLETTLEGVPTSGMLDRDLIRIMMRAVGASDQLIDAHHDDICHLAQELYKGSCPDLRDKVCPGAPEALEQITSSRIPAGLVTGNLTRIGWTKMERAGLRPHFQLGAFSEMGPTRSHLVKLALDQAFNLGLIRPEATVTLVGDHPNDIEAARNNGIRSIGVATGFSSPDELRQAGATLVLTDLREFTTSMLSAC
jgi:phosphoglycolate phosphatase